MSKAIGEKYRMTPQNEAEDAHPGRTVVMGQQPPPRRPPVSPRDEFHPALHGRNGGPRSSSSPWAGLGLYLVVVLLVLLAGPLILGPFGLPGIMLVQATCLIVPSLMYVRLTQGSVFKTFSLRPVDAWVVLGAAILGCTLWYVLLHLIMPVQEALLPVPETFMAEREKFFDAPNTMVGWILLWFSAAVTPAICEEALFRGVLLHSMRTRLIGWHSVLVVSVLFSFFHFNPYQLSVTFVQGVVMGWLVMRCRSIFSSSIFHLFNNTVVLAMSREADPVFPDWMPLLMGSGCVIGLLLVWYHTHGALFTQEDPDA